MTTAAPLAVPLESIPSCWEGVIPAAICTVSEDGTPYFVLEYVAGQPIDVRRADFPLSVATEFCITEVIGHDEENVRFVRGKGGGCQGIVNIAVPADDAACDHKTEHGRSAERGRRSAGKNGKKPDARQREQALQ